MQKEKITAGGFGCLLIIVLLIVGFFLLVLNKCNKKETIPKVVIANNEQLTAAQIHTRDSIYEITKEKAIENAKAERNKQKVDQLWESISNDFTGNVSAKEVAHYFTMLMNRHRLNIDEYNVNKIAARLKAIKYNTNGTVPEIAVLKHMYNYGKFDVDFFIQLEASALVLNDIK